MVCGVGLFGVWRGLVCPVWWWRVVCWRALCDLRVCDGPKLCGLRAEPQLLSGRAGWGDRGEGKGMGGLGRACLVDGEARVAHAHIRYLQSMAIQHDFR